MKKIKKLIVSCLSCLCICFVSTNVYVYIIGNKHIVSFNDGVTTNAEAIIVLGAGLKDGKPGIVLSDRLDIAIALYHQGKVKKIIMSGDHRSDDYNEVTAMKQYAIDRDVLSEDVYLDHYGIDTYHSMYRAKYVFGIHRAIVVTQTYHLYRAVYLGQELGIETIGVSSTLQHMPQRLQQECREFIARAKAVVNILMTESSTYPIETIDLNQSGDITNEK